MKPFITQCPNCNTSFKINATQLNSARGFVRCGSCLRVFSAEDSGTTLESSEHIAPHDADTTQDTSDNSHYLEDLQFLAKDDSKSKDMSNDKETRVAETVKDDPVDKPVSKSATNSTTELAFDGFLKEKLYQHQVPVIHPEPIQDIVAKEEVAETEEPADPEDDSSVDTLSESEEIEEAELSPDTDFTAQFVDPQTETEHSPTDAQPKSAEKLEEEAYSDTVNDREASDEESNRDSDIFFTAEFIDQQTGAKHSKSLLQDNSDSPANPELQALLATLDQPDSLGQLNDDEIDAIDVLPVEMIKQNTALKPLKSFPLILANLSLLGLLFIQYLWANFDSLAADSRYQASLGVVCEYFPCTIPEHLDLAAIYSVDLVVRSHPSRPDALLVDFIFRNEASFEQDFPLVELSFSDINNRLLINRSFSPDEYLMPELRQFEKMPVNSPIHITLEIVDPGPDAVNYSLAFRNP